MNNFFIYPNILLCGTAVFFCYPFIMPRFDLVAILAFLTICFIVTVYYISKKTIQLALLEPTIFFRNGLKAFVESSKMTIRSKQLYLSLGKKYQTMNLYKINTWYILNIGKNTTIASILTHNIIR